MSEQTKRMQILQKVAFEADNFYDEVKTLGEKASVALSSRKRSQITNLQGITNSTLKVSDVLDYIKTQTARDARQKDAHKKLGWHRENFGIILLQFVEEGTLFQKKKYIYSDLEMNSDLKLDKSIDGQEIYLLLIRAAMRQLAAQYEFTNFRNEEK